MRWNSRKLVVAVTAVLVVVLTTGFAGRVHTEVTQIHFASRSGTSPAELLSQVTHNDSAKPSPPAVCKEELQKLWRQYLDYFLENQYLPGQPKVSPKVYGLFKDRQKNFGKLNEFGQISTSASGLGCIALALAADKGHITHEKACRRIALTLRSALALPQEEGIGPHFVDHEGNIRQYMDKYATVDFSWLIAGGLWAAEHLNDPTLRDLSLQLYNRVNWQHWIAAPGVNEGDHQYHLIHGQHRSGYPLTDCWCQINGETLAMYLLATGQTDSEKKLSPEVWRHLCPDRTDRDGVQIASGSRGIFVHQWGRIIHAPSDPLQSLTINFREEEIKAIEADFRLCQKYSDLYPTFKIFRGGVISAGDGPRNDGGSSNYRYWEYSAESVIDGTANLNAAIASIEVNEQSVREILAIAQNDPLLRAGRYGFSNINVGHPSGKEHIIKINGVKYKYPLWRSPYIVGVDAGFALLALTNYLDDGLIQKVFSRVACIREAEAAMAKLTSTPNTLVQK